MSVMSTSARASKRVAGRPPKPPPTTTTRCLLASVTSTSLLCRPLRDERGCLRLDEPADGVDQSQMGEGLGEVAQMLARRRVDLLGVEQQRPGEVEQLLAQGGRPLAFTDHGQRGDQPEG